MKVPQILSEKIIKQKKKKKKLYFFSRIILTFLWCLFNLLVKVLKEVKAAVAGQTSK
jgi:hypothetical protein